MRTSKNTLKQTLLLLQKALQRNNQNYLWQVMLLISQSKNQNENRRRSSGGIVVYIKSDISQGIDYIKSEHSDIMWLKVKKQFFEIENDLFIGVIYISPKNSSNVKHKQDTYQILEKELSHYSRQGDIMLGGDFNSRLGKKYTDYIISDTNDYLPVDQDLSLDHDNFRNHKDKNENSYGKLLSDLCITHNLKILNGRTIGDVTGKFTCFSYNGNSTVDLVLATNTVKQKLITLRFYPLLNGQITVC